MWSGGWKKSKKSIQVEGGNVCGGWIFFFRINWRDSTFIREMRVEEGLSQVPATLFLQKFRTKYNLVGIILPPG